MKKLTVCVFLMILIGTSLFPAAADKPTTSPQKTVILGAQMGRITFGTQGTATFMVSTTSVNNSATGSLSWFTSLAATTPAAAPTGITSFVSDILNNAAVVTIFATSSAAAGSYYFKASFDSTDSSPVTLTIVQKQEFPIWVFVIFVGGILLILWVVTLSFVARGKLTGKDWISNSLGLPDGSVRALIALLFLLVIVLAATGHLNLADLPSWATGIVGTIIGFYFGAQTVSSAQQQQKQTPSISTVSLPECKANDPYPQTTLSAVGMTSPLTWSGGMPQGLKLDPATGTISGNPTAAPKAYPIAFAVTDSAGNGATKVLSITIT